MMNAMNLKIRDGAEAGVPPVPPRDSIGGIAPKELPDKIRERQRVRRKVVEKKDFGEMSGHSTQLCMILNNGL